MNDNILLFLLVFPSMYLYNTYIYLEVYIFHIVWKGKEARKLWVKEGWVLQQSCTIGQITATLDSVLAKESNIDHNIHLQVVPPFKRRICMLSYELPSVWGFVPGTLILSLIQPAAQMVIKLSIVKKTHYILRQIHSVPPPCVELDIVQLPGLRQDIKSIP